MFRVPRQMVASDDPTPMTAPAVAEALRDMSRLLALEKGNRFRARAFDTAAAPEGIRGARPQGSVRSLGSAS